MRYSIWESIHRERYFTDPIHNITGHKIGQLRYVVITKNQIARLAAFSAASDTDMLLSTAGRFNALSAVLAKLASNANDGTFVFTSNRRRLGTGSSHDLLSSIERHQGGTVRRCFKSGTCKEKRLIWSRRASTSGGWSVLRFKYLNWFLRRFSAR
jgi:hypothetical protein